MDIDLLFFRTHLSDLLNQKRARLKREIDEFNVESILHRDPKELCSEVVARYELQAPVLDLDKATLVSVQDRKQPDNMWSFIVVDHVIAVPFEGDAELFSWMPSRFTTVLPRGKIVGRTLHLSFSIPKGKEDTIKLEFDKEVNLVNSYLEDVRRDVEEYNASLNQLSYENISRRRETLSRSMTSLEGLGIKKSAVKSEMAETNSRAKHAQSSNDFSRQKAKIFLSYAREDHQPVLKLYKFLSSKGFTPWMDVENLLPGEKWKLRIEKEINQSDFFVACLSNNSVNRRGYLQKELNMALDVLQGMLDEDIYFIPARLEDCEMPRKIEDIHRVDLFEPDGYRRFVEAINVQLERRRK
jgi:hypothetical protein